jgi:hypothetical protein
MAAVRVARVPAKRSVTKCRKLLADRKKDRADVEDLLRGCGDLDRPYLDRWAARLGVTERLESALRGSGRA